MIKTIISNMALGLPNLLGPRLPPQSHLVLPAPSVLCWPSQSSCSSSVKFPTSVPLHKPSPPCLGFVPPPPCSQLRHPFLRDVPLIIRLRTYPYPIPYPPNCVFFLSCFWKVVILYQLLLLVSPLGISSTKWGLSLFHVHEASPLPHMGLHVCGVKEHCGCWPCAGCPGGAVEGVSCSSG